MNVDEYVERELRESPKTRDELKRKMWNSTFDSPEKVSSELAGALQRLKRAGKVKILSKRGLWALACVQVCSECGGRGWVKAGQRPRSSSSAKRPRGRTRPKAVW